MENDVLEKLMAFVTSTWVWVQSNFLEPERLIELAVIIAVILVTNLASRFVHGSLVKVGGEHSFVERLDTRFTRRMIAAAFAIMLLWAAMLVLSPFISTYLLTITANLYTAWLVIRLVASVIANRELARLVAYSAWSVAALNIMGLLDPIMVVLESAKLPLGEAEISALSVITGLVTFALLIWAAFALSALLERQVKSMQSVPPSAKELMTKVGKILLVSIAFLISLNATGIDLTALAVFGGALGVGIGFGLQKVVGNFISGIILLMDRSIKPGDVIETAGTYGTINRLAARYTSVITRDGTEFLIPNEDMITQPVVNWSHSHRLVRRRIPVQVSYDSDLRLAMKLMIEAANEEARVLKSPEARTLLKNFGENGVDLELRMWIEDPQNGVSNVASEVMLRIWDKFHENDIEFPFPQRVMHIKNDGEKSPL